MKKKAATNTVRWHQWFEADKVVADVAHTSITFTPMQGEEDGSIKDNVEVFLSPEMRKQLIRELLAMDYARTGESQLCIRNGKPYQPEIAYVN